MTEMHAETVHAVKVDGVWNTSTDCPISLEPLGRRVRIERLKDALVRSGVLERC